MSRGARAIGGRRRGKRKNTREQILPEFALFYLCSRSAMSCPRRRDITDDGTFAPMSSTHLIQHAQHWLGHSACISPASGNLVPCCGLHKFPDGGRRRQETISLVAEQFRVDSTPEQRRVPRTTAHSHRGTAVMQASRPTGFFPVPVRQECKRVFAAANSAYLRPSWRMAHPSQTSSFA